MVLLRGSLQNEFVGKSTEFLSNDILDDSFVKVFQPIRVVQKFLGSCRVHVTNRFVTTPTVLQKCYTIVCMVGTITSNIQMIQNLYPRYSATDKKIADLSVGIMGGIILVFSMSIINARFFNNEGNVRLVNKMQQIDRLMKINKNKSINNIHYKYNLSTALASSAIFLTLAVLSLTLADGKFDFTETIGLSWAIQTFLTELCSCSSHIVFFTVRIRVINSIIMKYFEKENINMGIQCRRCRSQNTESENFASSDTDVYMKHIFHGFTVFKDQYQFQILWFCGVFVAWILCTFEYGILSLRTSADKYLLLLDLIELNGLSLVLAALLLVLCVLSEIFFREVDRTKKLCIYVLSCNTEGPLREKTKRMLKLIEETPPSFSVYGMWCMDARLLLKIFQITTSLLVIILQFAFL